MGDNSIQNYFTWVAWTFATVFSAGSYRLAYKPSLLSFPIAFLASEYAHISAAVQVAMVLLLAKLNPRLLHTNMGKLFCLANCFIAGLQINLVLHSLRSAKVYASAMKAKGVRTPNLDAGGASMLLSLLAFGRSFLPKQVQSNEFSYAAMEDVDQDLVEMNKTTSKRIKSMLSNTGRGRRAKWLTLDIIRKKEHGDRGHGKDLLPVLFYIHGGGWTVGDKTFACRPMLEYIAATQEVLVVTINYRLAPERTFPHQLHDAKRALIWVKRNIKDHGGNPSKIVVAGESAGGHLSVMMALTCNNPAYQPEEEPDADTSVVGCVDLYGVHDMRDRKVKGLAQNVLFQSKIKANPEEFAAGSPTALVERMVAEKSVDPPPTLVIHGTRDSLAPLKGALKFFETLKKLRKVNQSSKKDVLVVQPTAHHAFGYLKTPRSVSTALAISDFLLDCVNTAKL